MTRSRFALSLVKAIFSLILVHHFPGNLSMRIILCLAALVIATNTFGVDSGDYRYTFLTVGEKSGSQFVNYDDEGHVTISFEFNDRGRGPKTNTRLELNADGIPVKIDISGNNYYKGEVSEHFAIEGETAAWHSKIENGSTGWDGHAFFMPNNAAPELMAILARALLATESASLPLLPSGTASITELAKRTLMQDGAGTNITLYGIKGLDSSPSYVWLDDDGRFFGVDYDWFGITPEGFESQVGVLKDAQTAATDEFFQTLTKNNTTRLDGLLAIRGARIFDSLKGEMTEPATVFTWKGKISAIYFEDVAIPDDATVIEARGKTLLPSLWDMHAHVSVESYFNYLAAGVTNVRDMANDPDNIYKLGDDVASGLIAGPDVYALGFIDKRGEFSAPTGRLIETEAEAYPLVDYYAQHGFHGIKLYSSIEPAWVAPIAAYAHKRNMVVMGHVPAYMNARQAIDAGYDEITHVNMVLLNFLGGENLDTRTPTRFKVPGEKAGDLDLASSEVGEFIELMKNRGIALDPTLSIFMDMFLNEPGQVSPVFRDIADHLPATIRRQSVAAAGFNAGQENAYARSAKKTMELVKLLHDRGILILPGTDNSLPGFTLVRELRYYVEAGIPAGEALQLATIEPARHLGQQERLGSITVGKDAHMFIVDGDPLADMTNLYRVEQVIKGRQLYFAPDLLEAQGFVPFAD